MAEQFGPYRLDHLIGRGGMGEVHRAYDTTRGRTVALKRLPASLAGDPEFQARFRRESALAARLSEPHIIPIHDFGEIGGRLYIDMRLVDGVDLATVISGSGPMPPRRAVSILAQVASALDAAHAAGLIHRDVKPSNVLVRGDGEDEFAYLIDFGIARATAGGDSGGTLTAAGATIGTLDYMAPERFESGAVDGRADVYALACVLYELLTGHPPFHGKAPAAMIHAHLVADPPRPTAERAGLPAGLDAVVGRGMAKDPQHRYPTAGALVAAARAALRAQTPAPTVIPPARSVPAATPRPPSWAAPGTPRPPSAVGPDPAGWSANRSARPDGTGAARPAAAAAPSRTATPRPPSWQQAVPPQRTPVPASDPRRFAAAPAPRPPRPAGIVVAFVLQVVSGALFLLGFGIAAVVFAVDPSTVGTSSTPAGVAAAVCAGVALVAALYLVCAFLAFGGAVWPRFVLAGVNGLGAIGAVTSMIGNPTASNLVVALAILAVAVGATVPMFTRSARAWKSA